MPSLALDGMDRIAEMVLIAFGVAAVALPLPDVIYLAVVAIILALRTTSRSRYFILILGLGIASMTAGADLAAAQQTPDSLRPNWQRTPQGLDLYFLVPESNPLTVSKVALGRRLFFDPMLSADRSVACASCHRPEKAFADSVPFSAGARGGRAARNTPSILNRAYGRTFFLDGRTRSLEETVLQPIQNPAEMAMELDETVSRLKTDASYSREFLTVFGNAVTEGDLAFALASYVRTLRSGDAPIDRFREGDRTSLSADARVGLRLFTGRGNCIACHWGPIFTDEKLHNTGIFVDSGDIGRQGITGERRDRGAFKTPSLRNVALTAPYMHNGSLPTLEAVIDFYDRGGNDNAALDDEVQPLGLSDVEKRQLVAFLQALTGAQLGS